MPSRLPLKVLYKSITLYLSVGSNTSEFASNGGTNYFGFGEDQSLVSTKRLYGGLRMELRGKMLV